MKIDFQSVLKLLPAIGAFNAALPEFKAVFDQLVAMFGEKDQAILRAAYRDVLADNDAGHERLQAKLAEAAAR